MDEKPIRGGGVGGGRGGGSSKRRCRYGAECRSRNCKFVHPPPTICTTIGDNNITNNDDANKKSNTKMPQEKNIGANPKRDRSKIQCRYGMECRNTRCPFFHHPAAAAVPVVTSPTCVRVPPPISNGSVPTTTTTKSPPKSSAIRRNGHNPLIIDTVEQQSSHPSAHSNGKSNTATTTTTTTTTPSRKATTKKKCRWGAGCRNKKCTFLHPGQVFDKDAVVQSPRQKATGLNKPKCSTVTPHKAMPSTDHRTKATKVSTTTRPLLFAHHPILPPSPAATQEHPLNKSVTPNNASYQPPGLLLPPPSSDPTVSRSPFQTNTTNMPIIDTTTQTSEVISRILFSPDVSIDDPISGFLGEDDESRERTPLYSKTSAFCSPLSSREGDGSRERTPLYSKTSAFRSPLNSMGDDTNGGKLESHAQFSQPATEASVEKNCTAFQSPNTDGGLESHALFSQPVRETSVEENHTAIHLQDQPPDADWLFEVLGLNDLDVNDTASSPMTAVTEDVMKEPFNATASSTNASFICTPPAEQVCTTFKSEMLPVGANHNSMPKGNKKPSKKLIPDHELAQSRSAALELRLESKQHATHNPELFFTLLQKCRSKQEMIKTALEQSMDSLGEVEVDGEEIDETNIVALLELNELLVGSINVAESSSRITKRGREKMEGGGVKKVNAVNSCPNESVEGSKKERDSSWKPIDKKSNTTKQVTKKTKPTENVGKQKKPAKKSSQPSKSVKITNVDNEKQETKPASIPPESESPIDKPVPSPTQDSAVSLQQEKEKMARMLEEARKQAAAARERKKSKKNKKFDRWLKQNEEERERRAKIWAERIAKENDYIDLIGKLLVAEFLRQSMNKAMGLTAERVLTDTHASEVIAKECREAYGIIFGGLKCRVVVAGSENKDMNGRHGTIRFWDREKEKFCVGLDTKKSPDSDVQFLIPETLDVLASSRPPKTDKKSTATSCDIHAPHLLSYGGVSLGFSFTLQKSHVVALGSAESTKIGLRLFCKSRDQEERMQKIEEEAEKKREEEDRKRRAARRAKENATWEKRKEQMRKDKEDYERMKQEWAKDRREFGGSMFDYEDDDEEECQCPRCRFGDRFSSSGGSFFFNIGGIPFRVRFDNCDSDEDSFFDEFDERWEEQLAEEKEEENRKQANVLGVEPEDDPRTIKLAYRKMALKFHPDKWKRDSQHGMSRKAAEDRFKAVQAAYDHMMSNFDD